MSDISYIKANSLNKAFGGETVIRDLSFEFSTPGIYVIEGDSGSGKTTLLRMIAGLETPDSGSLETAGRIGFVFQEPRLFDNVSLLENVKLVSSLKDSAAPLKLLEELGLGDSATKKAREASGGMRQRTAVARAVYYAPDILLCDEPFSAVDDANMALAAKMLERFSQKGILVIATHGGALPFEKISATLRIDSGCALRK